MSSERTFESLRVTDEDIRRSARLLDLPVDAFFGVDGTDPRQEVLKCMDSIDVAACPGSGKTTLLVAKLAILAEKWKDNTRGICVLAHTNAARHEIERHLGSTTAGRRLLGYPHYIGTIHGFVNEFLALPLLRSRGYGGTRFDNDISERKLLKLSGGGRKLPGYLYHKIQNDDLRISAVCHAHYVGENLDIRLKAGNIDLTLSRQTKSDSFKRINKWKCDILNGGVASYEDTFAFGRFTLKMYPTLAGTIRDRFPLLFIDEAQDNNKEQSAILSRIFMEGNNAVIRQRFGDANQAIYDSQGAEEAATDKFPGASKMELPNSYRFSQTIADIADPLGIDPYRLQGLGPKKPLTSGSQAGQHTIFLFDENSAAKVLEAYGELLLETFSDLELREEWFVAMAVGQVHKPPDEDVDHKFPHHVGHYWPEYDPELAKQEPTPRTFMQYVFAGQSRSQLQRETRAMVAKIAEGFLRLSDFAVGKRPLARPKHQHRHILQLLKTLPDIREQYQSLIVKFTVLREIPTAETWDDHWCAIVRSIAEAIAGSPLSGDADSFLTWNDTTVIAATPSDANGVRNNIYRYRKNGREVSIQAGSIHSVKGQTHTATLVLETFWYKHNLRHILPWITRNKYGWKKADDLRQKDRLKLHYVAMTRPTHLLCLAMMQNVLNKDDIRACANRGWRLLQVQPDGSTVPPGAA
jgi:DNA helicase II / ATP-dependent DNA helicase PcrA